MKLIYSFLFFVSFNSFATQQQNDYIEYKGQQNELAIDWSYPSPLEAYFVGDNKGNYPFEVLSTGNYRGHVATWQILNNQLYLTEIVVPKIIFNQSAKSISETQNYIELSDVLPKEYITNNKALASWFTGHLLVKSSPYKKWYKPEYSEEKHYTMEFQEYVIVQIKNGTVIAEKSFESDEFWNLTTKYFGYKSIDKEDLDIISSFYDYGSSFVDSDLTEEPKKLVYSEDDFDLFIERKFTNKINIPLTEYCIITDVSIDIEGVGWFSESDFKIKKGSNVLYLEMGSINVPNGAWNDFTGGSVQLLLPIDNISEGKIIQNENIYYINNFAKYGSPKSVRIDLDIGKIQKGSLLLEGEIELKSEEPETFQKINFDGKNIPIYSLLAYLKKHQGDREYPIYDADEVFKEIQDKHKHE